MEALTAEEALCAEEAFFFGYTRAYVRRYRRGRMRVYGISFFICVLSVSALVVARSCCLVVSGHAVSHPVLSGPPVLCCVSSKVFLYFRRHWSERLGACSWGSACRLAVCRSDRVAGSGRVGLEINSGRAGKEAESTSCSRFLSSNLPSFFLFFLPSRILSFSCAFASMRPC